MLKYVKSGSQDRYEMLLSLNVGLDKASQIFDRIDRAFKGQSFGGLFNAFTESRYGKNIPDDTPLEWIADSGGLQVITQGKHITDDLKNDIYNIQSEYSDIAMCFDEMPLYITGTASSRLDLSNRFFIKDKCFDSGRLTGLNVNKQIEIIRNNKSKTKVMLICQGNDVESYKEYFNGILSVIVEEDYKYIAGIAVSGACCGVGQKETIDMISAIKFLDIPNGMGNRLHLLGVGSINRIYPVVALIKSGYLDMDVSYDSTSHTSMYIRGEYFLNKSQTLGRITNKNSIKCVDDVYSLFGDLLGVTSNEFHKIYDDVRNKTTKTIYDNYNIDKRDVAVLIPFLFSMGSVYNFMRRVNEMMLMDDFDVSCHSFKFLKGVKTCDDMLEWKSKFGKYLKSSRVDRLESETDIKSTGLQSFF